MSAPPLPGQVRTARVLAASRMRTLRTRSTRLGAWVAFACLCASLSLVGMLADLLREAALRPLSDLFTIEQARAVLTWVVINPQGVLVAAAGFLAATAAFTVLSVPAPGRLVDVPHGHLVATGATTRFAEALASTLVSVVPAVQLLAVTLAAGLLTPDRQGRAGAVLLAWACWACLQVLTASALCWVSVLRRGGSTRTRRAVVVAGAAVAGGLGAAVLTGAASVLAAAALTVPAPVAWVAVLALGGVGLWSGVRACDRAASLPPVFAGSGRQRSARLYGSPRRVVVHALALAAWRSPQVRSPLLTVTAASAVALLAAGGSQQALPAVAVGVPLAWSLAFTSNFLAVHGAGGVWLGSLPRVGRPTVTAGAVVGLFGCLVPLLTVPLPALVLGTVDVYRMDSYAMLGVASSLLLTGVSVLLATLSPQPASAAHGQPLLSPGRTLLWMLLLGVLGALAWLAVEATTTLVGMGQDWHGWPYVGAATTAVLGAAALAVAYMVWPRVRTRSIATAGAA